MSEKPATTSLLFPSFLPVLDSSALIFQRSCFSFSHPWKCLCFLEAWLRPWLTLMLNKSHTIQRLEYQMAYSEGRANEAALFSSPCGRQCGTGQSPEIMFPSSSSWVLSPSTTKAFNLQSLTSAMEISRLFLGLVVRTKCDEDPTQMQGVARSITQATHCLTLSPGLFPEQISIPGLPSPAAE